MYEIMIYLIFNMCILETAAPFSLRITVVHFKDGGPCLRFCSSDSYYFMVKWNKNKIIVQICILENWVQ